MNFYMPNSYLVQKPNMKLSKSDIYESISLEMLGLKYTIDAYRKRMVHPYIHNDAKFLVNKDDMGADIPSTFDKIISGDINYYVTKRKDLNNSKNHYRLSHRYEVTDSYVCESTYTLYRLLKDDSYINITYEKKETRISSNDGFNIKFRYQPSNFYENSIQIKYRNKFDVTECNINPFTFVWPWDRDDGYFEMILLEHSLRNKLIQHIK